jgi:integrase
MPRVVLTEAFVRNAKCPEDHKKLNYFDSGRAGFLLEVRQSGGKTYYQRYRDRRGKERQAKIGPASILTLREARLKGRQICAQALLGTDPLEAKKQLRLIPTFANFVRDTYLPFAKRTKRSWQTDETVLRVHLLPTLGKLPLDEISNGNISEILNRMQNKGYSSGTTNRVLVLVRYIFNLARKWDVPGSEKNPTAGLNTAPDVCRERFLSQAEVRRLFEVLDNDQNRTAAQAIKLLLLTGGRRNEITHARWEYVDWTNRTLLVPRSKNGRARLIYLNNGALELLKSVQRVGDNRYIFPSPITGRPSASLHFPWSRIREAAGLPAVRVHDLRHSFASFLVNSGVSLYTVQALLGHSNAKTTQRYAHLANQTLLDATDILQASLNRVASPLDTVNTGG